MELFIQNGDYAPDGKGGFRRAEGSRELLQRVLFKLTARRGSFPFLPALGSELYRLPREKPSARQALAAQYVAEALREEPSLTVQRVELVQDGEVGRLSVYLEWQGEELTARLTV